MNGFIIYLVATSAIAAAVAVYDKTAAKLLPRNRVPEKALFLLGAAGGASAMYITMLLIRHKTRHKKFMVGLPVIIILQIAVLAYWRFFIR